MITGSWLLVKTPWITLLVTAPILLWWFYFLWLWPRLIRENSLELINQQLDQEQKSASGVTTDSPDE